MEHWKQWNTGVMSFKSFQFNVLTIRLGVKPFERFGNGKENKRFVLHYTRLFYSNRACVHRELGKHSSVGKLSTCRYFYT